MIIVLARIYMKLILTIVVIERITLMLWRKWCQSKWNLEKKVVITVFSLFWFLAISMCVYIIWCKWNQITYTFRGIMPVIESIIPPGSSQSGCDPIKLPCGVPLILIEVNGILWNRRRGKQQEQERRTCKLFFASSSSK